MSLAGNRRNGGSTTFDSNSILHLICGSIRIILKENFYYMALYNSKCLVLLFTLPVNGMLSLAPAEAET